MLRTVNGQPTLWESILPAELLVLPVELARVGALLDDPAFFAPFAPFFDAVMGRPDATIGGPSRTQCRRVRSWMCSSPPASQ